MKLSSLSFFKFTVIFYFWQYQLAVLNTEMFNKVFYVTKLMNMIFTQEISAKSTKKHSKKFTVNVPLMC